MSGRCVRTIWRHPCDGSRVLKFGVGFNLLINLVTSGKWRQVLFWLLLIMKAVVCGQCPPYLSACQSELMFISVADKIRSYCAVSVVISGVASE